jgi:hypothetical protein
MRTTETEVRHRSRCVLRVRRRGSRAAWLSAWRTGAVLPIACIPQDSTRPNLEPKHSPASDALDPHDHCARPAVLPRRTGGKATGHAAGAALRAPPGGRAGRADARQPPRGAPHRGRRQRCWGRGRGGACGHDLRAPLFCDAAPRQMHASPRARSHPIARRLCGTTCHDARFAPSLPFRFPRERTAAAAAAPRP